MSSKKGQSYAKDQFRQDFTMKKIDSQSIKQKVRVIQNNLVFINGLPSNLSSHELLKTQLYFGRYGKVTKIILNPSQTYKTSTSYQAYVTYQSQVDAALAITALDGFKLSQRPLKVSYGTTKYCTHFLRGYQCHNLDCFYLHKINKKLEIVNGDSRSLFKEQNNFAIDTVCDNLQQVINRSLIDPNQSIIEGFPTLTQMLDFLTETEVLGQSEVDRLKKKIKSKKPQIYEQVKNDANEQQKVIKSSSFSTTDSPIKPDLLIKTQKNQFEDAKDEMVIDTIKEVDINETIQKQILKELGKTKNQCKSKFGFVGKTKCRMEEIDHIKSIFEKYLIVQN